MRTKYLLNSTACASRKSAGSWLLLLVPVAIGLAAVALAEPWAHAFRLLIVAPILEEVVFRLGLHEGLLRRASKNANIWTALAFAAAHAAVHADPMAVLTFIPALAIGAVFERSRSVWPCIALHGVFNAVWLGRSGIPS